SAEVGQHAETQRGLIAANHRRLVRVTGTRADLTVACPVEERRRSLSECHRRRRASRSASNLADCVRSPRLRRCERRERLTDLLSIASRIDAGLERGLAALAIACLTSGARASLAARTRPAVADADSGASHRSPR